MTIYRLGLASVLALVATTVLSNDLASIERRIAKEPSYEGQPYYSLLVFGPNAERQAWIVVDGETLYFDRNNDGDLTAPDERIELDVEATKRVTFYPGSRLKGMNIFKLGEFEGYRLQFEVWIRKDEVVPERADVRSHLRELVKHGWENATLLRVHGKSSAQTPVLLCRNPEDAQISHLDGQLTFKPALGDQQTLKRPRNGVLSVNIGTFGFPTKHSCRPVFSSLTTNEIPADKHPVAHFEFENKIDGQPPIRLDVTLDKRCCGDQCYGQVDVPDEASDAPAKLKVEFSAWKEGHVKPATFEIPLE